MTAERWRHVGEGMMGHIWHDQHNNRYVISDWYGPPGVAADGTTAPGTIGRGTNHLTQNERNKYASDSD